MGLAAICCPQHTTERDKVEEILEQKTEGNRGGRSGALHFILIHTDSPHPLYINKLLTVYVMV